LVAALLALPARASDPAAGKVMFSRCAACHNAAKGGPNMIGPNLYGVVGRRAGTKSGFSYSAAIKNSGITWTKQKLDAYIAHPAQMVPANRMAFTGIPDPKQRADLIAYLDTLK